MIIRTGRGMESWFALYVIGWRSEKGIPHVLDIPESSWR